MPGGPRLALERRDEVVAAVHGLAVGDEDVFDVELEERAQRGQRPLLLTEFGGIAFTPERAETETWGYSRARGGEDFVRRYRELLTAAHRSAIAGFCYTQLADTYQEANGLLTADREPKVPLDELAAATVGRVRHEFEEAGAEMSEGVSKLP